MGEHVELNPHYERLKRDFIDFEYEVHLSMGKYSQFTIDWVEETTDDLMDQDGSNDKIEALKYNVENILEIAKEGNDKELFKEIHFKLTED